MLAYKLGSRSSPVCLSQFQLLEINCSVSRCGRVWTCSYFSVATSGNIKVNNYFCFLFQHCLSPAIIGTLWAGRQSITGEHRNKKGKKKKRTYTPQDNLKRSVFMFFGVWEETKLPRENQSMHRENMQKETRPGFGPRPFLLQGSSATCVTL